MAKATTLAAQLNKTEQERLAAEAQEDLAAKARPVSEGQVWVRLIRPCFDKEGRLHEPGVVLLDADAVPSSAKVLTKAEAAAAESEE